MPPRLPDFQFHSIELHLDPDAHHQELYRYIQPTQYHNRRLGTRIWWGFSHTGEAHCIKEFYRADPAQYMRQLPDPIWRSAPLTGEPTGHERGLRGQRARSYDERTFVPMDTGTIRAVGQDALFRDHFNAYAFELDALLTQFARHYGYNQIVQADRWGPVVMDESLGPRLVVEMERLQPLPAPRVGDYLSILHRILEMMSAVTQLHAMAIPVRCYPPELVRDLELARQHPITRSFHYDLSPDQFMLRPATHHTPEQVVLIDFNSSRMAHAEYSNFFWYAIPGKDYFQPPERRKLHDYRDQNSDFRSSPVYDLYALLTIALFYLSRQHDEQAQPAHLPGWHSPSQWQQWLRSPDFFVQLEQQIATNRGIDPAPLLGLIAATLPYPPRERREALMALDYVGWHGIQDWMLVPKAMNALARYSLGREFRVGWYSPMLSLSEGDAATPIHQLLDPRQCAWQPGATEQGRIDHPPLDLQQIYFVQSQGMYPIVRNGRIEPTQAGDYEVLAVWRGCVDFAHPLHVRIRPYREPSVSLYDDVVPEAVPEPVPIQVPEPVPPRALTTPYPLYDATIVETPIPAPAPEALAPWDEHTLRPMPNMLTEPMQEPISEVEDDTFWSAPPDSYAPENPGSYASPSPGPYVQAAPDPYTANYSREKHHQPQAYLNHPPAYSQHSQDAPVSPGNGHAYQGRYMEEYPESRPDATSPNNGHMYDGHLPSGSIAYEEFGPQPATPVGWFSDSPVKDVDGWLMQLATCSQEEELGHCESQMILQFGSPFPIDLTVQLHTRRCELAIAQGDLSLGWPSLNIMVQLLRRGDVSKLHTGVLLNNLTVYCYLWAWKEQRLPIWDTQVGLDPLSHLRHWLQLSEPPGNTTPPPQMRELRQRSRETITCALRIQQALKPR